MYQRGALVKLVGPRLLSIFFLAVKPFNSHGHALTKRAKEGGTDKHSTFFIVSAVMIPFLVILSGIFAGLTLGYMSLDETQLRVLAVSGSPKQQVYAKKIQPIRKNGHLLLTTLLLGNMILNETLPVLSQEALGGGIQAVVVSTVLIVIFAEIIPQSLCSRYGLQIGAYMAVPTQCLIYLLFIISWPVSKLLEFALGPHHGIVYRRGELKELIYMHSEMEGGGGDLANDTVTIVGGALDFQAKVAQNSMTPINEVFMLPVEAKLDYATLAEVVKKGHSRVPVYEMREVGGQKFRKILGIMLVKQCVLLDPEDATPLRDIPLNKVPFVPFDEPLLGILDRFQEGHSHMAIVTRVSRVSESKDDQGSVDIEVKVGLTRRFLNKVGLADAIEENDEEDVEKGAVADEKTEKGTEKEGTKRSPSGVHVPLEQTMPSDAVLSKEGALKFFADMEQPFGIITLEDVIEELIGEEILDEYDEPKAGAASTFVPEEAQRIVAAAAISEQKAARGIRNPASFLALRKPAAGTRTVPTRSSSLPLRAGEPAEVVVAGAGDGADEEKDTLGPNASKVIKGTFKSQVPPEKGPAGVKSVNFASSGGPGRGKEEGQGQ